VKTIAKEIHAIIDTAWTALSNADSRMSYRKQLFDKTERQYAADMLVKQGELALIRGDRVNAIEALETAVELDPSNRNRTLLTSAREGRR
jgi:Flp pilus assembly protein TadD